MATIRKYLRVLIACCALAAFLLRLNVAIGFFNLAPVYADVESGVTAAYVFYNQPYVHIETGIPTPSVVRVMHVPIHTEEQHALDGFPAKIFHPPTFLA